MSIRTSSETKRGCGYRAPGGKYLVSGGMLRPCGKLPIPLKVCPTCGVGVKPTRGWTWLDGDKFLEGQACGKDSGECMGCPLADSSMPIGRVGLLWIGEQFYDTPEAFMREVIAQGVSRRIATIPQGFKVGNTLVWVAHRKAIVEPCSLCGGTTVDKTKTLTLCTECDGEGTVDIAAVFHAFIPSAIEYIVKGTESEAELERLEEQGCTLVKVVQVESAVVYQGQIYCERRDCVGRVNQNKYERILPNSQWGEYPRCCVCNKEHTYVKLLDRPFPVTAEEEEK